MEYFSRNPFTANILQTLTPCKVLNRRILRPKYPPRGEGVPSNARNPKTTILKAMPDKAPPTQDEVFMQRALKLAAETIGLASPNPQVGCVLTQNPPGGGTPKVIGEGAHLYDNRDHAEIVALKQAVHRGFSATGAPAYLAFEPCRHLR